LGYKTPSIFTEEAETLLFQNVLPIGNRLKAERSYGGTLTSITGTQSAKSFPIRSIKCFSIRKLMIRLFCCGRMALSALRTQISRSKARVLKQTSGCHTTL
jgi:energy-converting hydrogenase Eha subunit B